MTNYKTANWHTKYKLAHTDACPLCGLSNSCTHIASECKTHNNHFIRKHSAAFQLNHAAMRTALKGGGTIYSPHYLRLISKDARAKQQITDEGINDLNTPSPHTQ